MENKTYRVNYGAGNGYTCGCCRSTWNDYENFYNEESLVEWLTDFEVRRTSDNFDDQDRWITDICIIEDVTEKFLKDITAKAETEKAKRLEAAEKEKALEKVKKEKEAKEKRHQKYQRLQKEFGKGTNEEYEKLKKEFD